MQWQWQQHAIPRADNRQSLQRLDIGRDIAMA